MAAITSAANGDWDAGATWTGGTKPVSGDTVTVNHAVNVDTSEACSGLTVSAGQSLTIANGGTLAVDGGTFTNNGTIEVLGGGTLTVSVNMGGTGNLNLTGSSGSSLATLQSNSATTARYYQCTGTASKWQWANVILCPLSNSGGLILAYQCWFKGYGAAVFGTASAIRELRECWFSDGFKVGLPQRIQRVTNLAMGYRRDGTPASLQDFCTFQYLEHWNAGINGLLAKDGAAFNAISQDAKVAIDGLGYLPASMTDQMTGTPPTIVRGSSAIWGYLGVVERSTANPPNGKTYHARLTPRSAVVVDTPLEFSVRVPVESGDNISVTAKASRSGDSSDCADVVIDPEGAWFTPTTVAWDLTNNHLAGTGASTNAAPGTTLTYATGGFDTIGIVDGTTKVNITAGTGATPGQYTITGHTDTTLTLATSPGASATAIAFTVERYYDLPTCAATGAGGTGAKGTVRVVFRMKEYSAAQYLDIGDITITCGGTAYVVSCQNWANGMPVPDEPAASGGGGAIVMHGLGQIGSGVY